MHALGGRVDGRKRLLHVRVVIQSQPLVFGVHQLVVGGAVAHLAEAAQTRATGQGIFLRRGEMKKPQHHRAGAIGHLHQQRTALAEAHPGVFDLDIDHRLIARAQAAHRDNPGAILIP